jgi:hypothetical protein
LAEHNSRDQQLSAGEAETRRGQTPREGEANQPSSDGLVAWLKDNFGRLDEDNNGKINKREIQRGIVNPELATANGAIYLSALQDQLTPWTMAFEAEKGINGYTKDGLSNFEKAKADPNLMSQNQERLNLLGIVTDFPRIDRGQDDRIEMQELERALKKPAWSPSQIANIEAAKKHFDQLLYASDDGQNRSQMSAEDKEKEQRKGISREDLQAFPDPKSKSILWMDNAIRWFDRRLTEIRENPDLQTSQGLNNGCFFLAPTLQMQMRDPASIRSMIKDNPDGTRTVTFPGDKENPITVPPPTEAELVTYSNNRDVATLEKAFGLRWYAKKVQEANKEDRDPPEAWPSPSERLQFGFVTYAMQLLTGRDAEQIDPDKKSQDELHDYLKDVHEKGKPLVISSEDSKSNALYGVLPRHSFVAEYNPQTRELTVTNPLWLGAGTQEPSNLDHSPLDGKNDRTFNISLQVLRDRFFEVVTTKD